MPPVIKVSLGCQLKLFDEKREATKISLDCPFKPKVWLDFRSLVHIQINNKYYKHSLKVQSRCFSVLGEILYISYVQMVLSNFHQYLKILNLSITESFTCEFTQIFIRIL